MKIAFNTRLMLKNRLDGIGWFTYETTKRITEQHPEHEFFLIFDRPYSNEFSFAENVTPVVIGPPARHPFLWYLWLEFSLPRIFKKYKPDIFVSTDGYLSLSADVPSLAVIHDINFAHRPLDLPFLIRTYYKYYFPKFARKAKKIVTVSEYSKNDISLTYSIDKDKIDVVYNGSNELYQPLPEAQKEKTKQKYTNGAEYFIFIGSLIPRKNVSRLLQAFDKFKTFTKTTAKLLIVGSPMFKTGDMKRKYAEMRHKSDVVFTGRLNPADLRDVLGSALALTFVPYFEGFGIPVLEAMYCDVPVITSNVTSMPEVAGDAALLVNPFSVDAIAEAMKTMHDNSDVRKKLIEKGRIRRQRFSWDKTAEKLWTSIESVM